MNPEENNVLAAHGRIESAAKAAWNEGLLKSSPLAVLMVGFDQPESEIDQSSVALLERALRVHCGRTHDVVLRRTRNEFIALLPGTTPAGARHVGEQLLEAMRAEDSDDAHRVSVGVAVAVPDEQRDALDLLRRAESAMQAARDNGGDRCVGGVAPGTAAPPPKGALAQLRDLLPGKKKDLDRKRRTD